MEIAALIAFIISSIGMMYCVGELDMVANFGLIRAGFCQ